MEDGEFGGMRIKRMEGLKNRAEIDRNLLLLFPPLTVKYML